MNKKIKKEVKQMTSKDLHDFHRVNTQQWRTKPHFSLRHLLIHHPFLFITYSYLVWNFWCYGNSVCNAYTKGERYLLVSQWSFLVLSLNAGFSQGPSPFTSLCYLTPSPFDTDMLRGTVWGVYFKGQRIHRCTC